MPTGDRLGRWDVLPTLWADNANAAPEDKAFSAANYPKFHELSDGALPDGIKPINCTNFEKEHSIRLGYDGAYSVDVDYEKVGIRFVFDVALAAGFGLTFKTGIVEYTQTPTFKDMSKISSGDKGTFLNDLMKEDTRCQLIQRDMSLCLARQEVTAFEDTFAQFYWSYRLEFDDEQGNHIVSVAPYVGAGVWLPTGKRKNQDKAFSMPTGHDGFWGVNLEAALNFDFVDTVLFNVGIGGTFFETKTQNDIRVPHRMDANGACPCNFLSSLYPWKTRIRRTYGPGICFNASLTGKNIIDSLSVYFDYLYCKHEEDTISMKECTDGRNEVFDTKKMERESFWKSQMFQLGFNYQVTPNLAIGCAGQWHISGVRVYKTQTILGSVTFTF